MFLLILLGVIVICAVNVLNITAGYLGSLLRRIMKIEEIIDNRVSRHFVGHQFSIFPEAFLIGFYNDLFHDPRLFLIWSGGDIKLRRKLGNKLLRKISTRPVEMGEARRTVVGSFLDRYFSPSYMKVTVDDDYWTLGYHPDVNVRVLDEVRDLLERMIEGPENLNSDNEYKKQNI